MAKKLCVFSTAIDLQQVTAQSIQDVRTKRLNVREAFHVQKSVKNMVELAKAQLQENQFLGRKESVSLLSESKTK
jgi:hypothetical protein